MPYGSNAYTELIKTTLSTLGDSLSTAWGERGEVQELKINNLLIVKQIELMEKLLVEIRTLNDSLRPNVREYKSGEEKVKIAIPPKGGVVIPPNATKAVA